MAQAIGDPEEIRSFSNTLEHYLNTVEEETGRLLEEMKTDTVGGVLAGSAESKF